MAPWARNGCHRRQPGSRAPWRMPEGRPVTDNEMAWTKAARSVASGACVELAADGELVALRDSKNPDVVLHFTRGEMRAFLDGAAHHEFDRLVE